MEASGTTFDTLVPIVTAASPLHSRHILSLPACRYSQEELRKAAHGEGPCTDHPLALRKNPGDGEHGLTRERGTKTERWKQHRTGGESDRVEDIFPRNQTVHIFILARRPTPIGHQYAKPKACCVCLLCGTREEAESNSFQ